MPLLIRAAALVFCASLWAATQTTVDAAQAAPATQAAAPAADGKEILTRKCFQCHQASMWTSLKGDRRAWEGVLYRMVGRGALWTEAEINAMAAFLAQTRGPK
jgi:cytochrome c5